MSLRATQQDRGTGSFGSPSCVADVWRCYPSVHPHKHQPTPEGRRQVSLGTCLWGLVLSTGRRKRWPRTVPTRAEYVWSPSTGQSCRAMCACSWLGNTRRQERWDSWQASSSFRSTQYCRAPPPPCSGAMPPHSQMVWFQ